MAGGKLSPRQKMINLMYLVFIAMLATQMDKQVLSAFGFIKEKVEDANEASSTNITAILAGLETKASDQPEKYSDLNQKAQEIHSLSNNFVKYLDRVKDSVLANVEEEDRNNYESMSGGDRLDELFFTGEGFTTQGDEFLTNINNYRDKVIEILGDEAEGLVLNINKRFNTDPDYNDEGIEIPWLRSRYEGMPMITSLANMTQIQGDIKNTEAEIYTNLLGGKLDADNKINTNNFKGIVRLDKTAYFVGERVTGQVVLGKYDDQLVPTEVKLGPKDITKDVENGQVILDFPAGNVGKRDIKGFITFMQDGEPQKIPFESSYSVIAEPNDAIVSADKMNVVYRGLDNPVSISVPGVGNNNVNPSVSAGNKLIDKGDGKYVLNPGKGNEVKINVTAKLSSGKVINTPKIFRIKDIPAAAGTVRGDFGVVPMPKSSLNNTPINVELPDFVFELEFVVKSFTVKVPGQLAVKVNGNKFDARAKKILAKAKRGDVITIFDIKANEKKKGVPLKKVLPVSIQITN